MVDRKVTIPKSIAAGRAMEGGLWKFTLALAEESAKGHYDAVQMTQALADAGVTSTTGEPYGERWIRELIQVGAFVAEFEPSQVAELTKYPVKIILAAGKKSQWDLEAMQLRLQGEKVTMHGIYGSLVTGTPRAEDAVQILDRLPAAERAKVATDLVAQGEVKEAILRSQPSARLAHLELTDDIVRESGQRSETHTKSRHPSVSAHEQVNDIDRALDHLSQACELLTRALAEGTKWDTKAEHDTFRRFPSLLSRVKRYVAEIEDLLGVEVEEV